MGDGVSNRFAGPLLALVSLTLVAVAAEVGLRRQHARQLERMLDGDLTRELCTEPDPELVYRYVPGSCGHNSRGYADEEHPLAKPPGTWRFAVIGDSVAAGHGVTRDERFDRVAERRFAAAGVRAEAVNLARTGYSTAQELRVLEGEAYAYAPDAVVWVYLLNDPAHPLFHYADGGLGQHFVRPCLQLAHRLRRLAFDAREWWRGRGCPEEWHHRLHCVYADRVAAHLARIGALARERATPTLLVLHPVFEEESDLAGESFAELHASLARQARAEGLAVLDLRDAYAPHRARDLQQDPGWFDPWHPNARGHALMGEAVAAALLERGPVPKGLRKQDEAGDRGGQGE